MAQMVKMLHLESTDCWFTPLGVRLGLQAQYCSEVPTNLPVKNEQRREQYRLRGCTLVSDPKLDLGHLN